MNVLQCFTPNLIFHFTFYNRLLRSISRYIVTDHLKGGLETRPLKAFFLKTSHTTSSQEDLRIYLVRRNYCF